LVVHKSQYAIEDPGCTNAQDTTENTDAEPDFVIPACYDGEDNDGDDLIDYPEDPQCAAAGDVYERLTCEVLESVATVSDSISYSFAPEIGYIGNGTNCAFSSGQEAVFTLEVNNISEIVVTVTDDEDGEPSAVYTALRTECDSIASELACYTTATDRRVFNEIEPGLYFLVVHKSQYAIEDPFTVNIQINPIECADGEDNDEDGLIDADDLGCESLRDLTEDTDADPEFVTPECADEVDNDEDGQIDYPADPECLTQGDIFEMPSCDNYSVAAVVTSEGGTYEFSPEEDYEGIEVSCGYSAGQEAVYALYIDSLSQVTVSATDESGSFSSVYMALRSECDYEDTELGCYTSTTPGPRAFQNVRPGLYFLIVHRTEFSANNPFTVEIDVQVQECGDGVDNDADGAIDAQDPGCDSSRDLSESTDSEPDFEAPVCSDGEDNDEDGDTDYPNDTFCTYAGGSAEGPFCELFNDEIQVVTESINFTVDNSTYMNSYTRATSANGLEVPFVLLLSQTSNVVITRGSDFDTYLHMREGVCDSQEALYAYNDDTNNFNAQLVLNAVAPGVYYVFVDGFAGDDVGQITVDVTVSPSAE
jgi:hypothetical protein